MQERSSPQAVAPKMTATTSAAEPKSRQLGLVLLTGVVVGSMIGGGSFNLPQNMAQGAGLGAVIIAWIVTLVGMFFLSNAFRTLADKRPDLTAGIYSYAREGFGKFAGFMMAWGYWISSFIGNVAFALLIMQILGYFFPVFGNGQNVPSLIGGSILIWAMCFLVLSGVKRAALLNVLASVINVVTISVALIIMAAFSQVGNFSIDVWGQGANLGSVLGQVKSTMLVTLWVFIGIEGAVVVSDRARNKHDVGPATFIGLAVCTTLYALLSVLPFGTMTQATLSGLANPSAAYVLKALVGEWGAIFVNVSLLISVLSCWVAWTILTAELPFMGARDKVFPKFLAAENRNAAAAPSLWLSSVLMQITIFVVLVAHDAWIWLISVAGVMILPPYLASTAYLWKYASTSAYKGSAGETKRGSIVTGVLGTGYSAWLLYAAGPQYLLLSTIMFMVGIPVFWWAQKEQKAVVSFTTAEKVASGILVLAAIAAVVLFAKGIVSVS